MNDEDWDLAMILSHGDFHAASALLGACASVGISHNKSTGEMLRSWAATKTEEGSA